MTQAIPNIFLIGPMGAGKSTIGRLLAQALKRPFIDSDHEIERRCGADIPWIFDIEGETGFRDRESAMIDELTQRQGIVLATGGGAVLRPENRHHLHKRGVVVLLDVTVRQQLERTRRDQSRPLLQTENPRARLEAMRQERNPLYRQTAHLILQTDRRPPRMVTQDLRHRIKQHLDHTLATTASAHGAS